MTAVPKFYRAALSDKYKRIVLDAMSRGYRPREGIWFRVRTYFPVSYPADIKSEALPSRYFQLKAFPYYNAEERLKEWIVLAKVRPEIPLPPAAPIPMKKASNTEPVEKEISSFFSEEGATKENEDFINEKEEEEDLSFSINAAHTFSNIGTWYLARANEVAEFKHQQKKIVAINKGRFPKSLLLQYVPSNISSERLFKTLKRHGLVQGVMEMNTKPLKTSKTTPTKKMLSTTDTKDWLVITPVPNKLTRLLHKSQWDLIEKLSFPLRLSDYKKITKKENIGLSSRDEMGDPLLFAHSYFELTPENKTSAPKINVKSEGK
ncbi:hypothetical protein POMI540_2093 [Schizosaccharomyces pombe]